MAGSSSDHDATPLSYFKYDVFLSFRGYTRLRFTDTLYHALVNKRIETFRDRENLRTGEELEGALVEAIERSRMSVLILCDEYPTSKWCLDELLKIMECSHNGTKRPVLPVYYYVEKSDVQYQPNEYAKAMTNHQEKGRYNHKLEAWRSALSQVGKIYGPLCNQNTPWGVIIDNIVEEVSRRLPSIPLYIDRPLGLDSQLEEAKSLLEIDSHSACFMLGIHGDGELRKFVLELYNEIRGHFKAGSFLSNVSEKTKRGGLEGLQKTLLSEMGEEVKTELGSISRGSSEIRQRLGQKRVLLVLDDVDSIQPLESLAGAGDWFGPGSRIITTTRNEGVLDKHALKKGVEIKKFCFDEGEFEGMESVDKQKRYVVEEDVVGFEDDIAILIKKLQDEDSHNNVVSIIGMGGLGKTTLARKIYSSKEVKKLFPYHAWSYVSKDYNKKEVLLRILDCLMSSTSKFKDSSEEVLKNEVGKCLKWSKYLVVLDDIWEPEAWDDLRDTFPNHKNGSKILITSRNEMVANYTNPSKPPHFLRLLDQKESWELFCKKVFLNEECPSNLDPLGRSIVESCKGLPLAIITLAGLVAKRKRTEQEWLRIKGYVSWHLAQDKTKVMDVLKLSYDYLPRRLKPCFLYLGIYPEDYEIPAKELIQLWIAEGFIQPHESGTSNAPEPEDVGEDYLGELVDRSLIQVSSTRSYGGVKTCKIHDLLRELCILESKANNSLEVFTESNIHANNTSNPHRLSFLCNAQSYVSSVKPDTRSLFFFAGAGRTNCKESCLKNFQSIQVLHLQDQVYFTSDSNDLETMIHLKYLRLKRPANRKVYVPYYIWNLPKLETLDLEVWAPFTILDGFWKLDRLRHVYVRCSTKLPPAAPQAPTILWNLQTLYGVALDQTIASLFSNNIFPNLRKLALKYGSRKDDTDSLFSRFSKKKTYQACTSDYSSATLHELLKSLKYLSKLRRLKLLCNDFCLSSEAITAFPPNLIKITLSGCGELDSRAMHSLGQLANLQSLSIYSGSYEVPLSCVGGGFSRLQVLKLEYSSGYNRGVLDGGEIMPPLRCLVMKQCLRVTALPKQLWSLTTLQKVDIVGPSDELERSLRNVELKKGCKLTVNGYTDLDGLPLRRRRT